MENAFRGATNFDITASDDAPVLSGLTSMKVMFRESGLIGQMTHMNAWDVSSVTDMSFMFFGASAFNSNVGNWTVSSVTNMQAMFRISKSFTGAGMGAVPRLH